MNRCPRILFPFLSALFVLGGCTADSPPASDTLVADAADTAPGSDTAAGDGVGPGSVCDAYCDLALAHCMVEELIYGSEEACQAACADFPINDAYDPATSGPEDSLQCRLAYAAAAEKDPFACAAAAKDGGCMCSDVTRTAITDVAYSFASTFEPFVGFETVSYAGQVQRQVLIADLKGYIGSLTGSIDDGSYQPTDAGEVVEALTYYYDFDADSDGGDAFALSTDPSPLQTSYNDLGSKNLKSKFAGNDSKTDHKVWADAFQGWADTSLAGGTDVSAPEGLLLAFFAAIESNAIGRANGVSRFGVDGFGAPLTTPLPVHVTAQGQDLQQLVQKFLTVALSFSQGTDDYLDDDIEGKGLSVDNGRDGCHPYSALMHHWDEAFGYYGAARDNDLYAASEIAGKCVADATHDCLRTQSFDANDDGAIDLTSEYNFGHSQNAAKRTHGSKDGSDFKTDTFQAFVDGRALITHAGPGLSPQEENDLRGFRDIVVTGWEAAIAATAIHYINALLDDMDGFGSDVYSFTGHAKHWSELKGFSLGLQFNPRSPLTTDDFAAFHVKIGDAPVLPDVEMAAQEAYKVDLLAARTLLETAYGFSATDVQGW